MIGIGFLQHMRYTLSNENHKRTSPSCNPGCEERGAWVNFESQSGRVCRLSPPVPMFVNSPKSPTPEPETLTARCRCPYSILVLIPGQ